MQQIIYDVAVSADGFIAGPSADVSKFPHSGAVVDDYIARLGTYACALMGRATYEFGYDFGLAPGANPYPHMQSVVISSGIDLPAETAVEVVRTNALERIDELRQTARGAIYLCGGGVLAGRLLSLGRIDVLRLKRAAIFLGSGTRLFGPYTGGIDAKLVSSKLYDDGVIFQEFDLR